MKSRFLLLLPPAAFAVGFAFHPSESPDRVPIAVASVRKKTYALPAVLRESTTARQASEAPAPHPPAPHSLAEVLAIPTAYHRGVAARLYFDSLVVGELPRAMQELIAMRETPESEIVMNLFRSWGARAPEQATEAALALPSRLNPQENAAAAARAWGRFSPEAARQWADTHLEESLRDKTVTYIDGIVTEQREAGIDPHERITKALPTGEKATWPALRRAFYDLTRADSAEAARVFMALPEDRKFSNLANLVFSSLLKNDAQAAMKMLGQLSPKNARVALKTLGGRLEGTSLATVRDYALALPLGETRAALLGDVAHSMTLDNIGAACDFVRSLPAQERFAGLFDFWEISAANDPLAVAREFVKMRDEAGADAASSLDAATMLRRGSMRFPQKGADAALLLQAKERNTLLNTIAGQWVSRDPQAAFAWAAAVPDESARASAIYKIAARAAEHDATQTAQWVEQIPVGTGRDSAARAMAEQTFDTDPDGALAWARSLSTPKDGAAALASAVNRWRYRNSTATHEWLQSTALSAEEREAIKNAGSKDFDSEE